MEARIMAPGAGFEPATWRCQVRVALSSPPPPALFDAMSIKQLGVLLGQKRSRLGVISLKERVSKVGLRRA